MNIFEKLLHIDRRYIFLCVFLAVLLPFLTGLTVLQGKPSPATTNIFDYIEALPEDSVIMLSFDYGPAGMPEMHPMGRTLTRHILSRNLRLIAVTIHPQGPLMAADVLQSVGDELGAEYGRDYVNLGFKPGGAAVIAGMGESIAKVYDRDMGGTPIHELPVMRGVRNYDDVALMVDLASGNAPNAWIAFAHERYRLKMAAGVTAVMATDFYPYLQSGQLLGIINGLRGAAEYEVLVGHPDMGSMGMSSQSITHLLIILFVILGNIGYFAGRRRQKRESNAS